MIVYHEVDPAEVDSILEKGLKRTSRGDKGDDKTIIKTDKLLDDARPDELRHSGVSRDDNLYAYMAVDTKIIRITDGKAVNIDEFLQESKQAVLRLEVETTRCFVSDLDRYDALKKAVETDDERTGELVEDYWQHLVPLHNFTAGMIRRPEVMVTYDVLPTCLEVVKR